MVERESRKIQEMFGAIAHRYDFLNHLLSLSTDRYWRRHARQTLAPFLSQESVVLDLCTGTGDLALEISTTKARVIGCDFCHPMLLRGAGKVRQRKLANPVRFVEGDALQLPFPSRCFDAVAIAFGLRNLEDYRRGLAEIHRVIGDTGVLAILEFTLPKLPLFRQVYRFYFTRILPRVGRLISGTEGPYSYLPESVRTFPAPLQLDRMLLEAGFSQVSHRRLTGGVVTLHLGRKGLEPVVGGDNSRVRY
ncbi:MAG: bifunctional demethylmenaquinone methyltransferase/2-methoxy-6-polyprenyl-1,4-benzoquinol methylase UbiE [Acidobacteriota bacterium]